MKILSDYKDDVRHKDKEPGGYEWWYFDAISGDGRIGLVVIFYEGNPFSTRYNRAIMDSVKPSDPSDYPAVSISIYEEGEPIYYSFTEFEPRDASFSKERPNVWIGAHRLEMNSEEELAYRLQLEEILPSGDQLEAELTFRSPTVERSPFHNGEEGTASHWWNLVQPRAKVEGTIYLSATGEDSRTIDFNGQGYHDHNLGQEPMRDEFSDWYWGRFHFNAGTLVYYVMNRQNTQQHQAWLIDQANSRIIEIFSDFSLRDKGLTVLGLHTARKIGLRSDRAEVRIQQSKLLDNGPFYQRYMSDAYLRISDQQVIESQTGITEYIYPSRIYARIFWPFVDMRIRYTAEGPHWVQRSKRLYRWTW